MGVYELSGAGSVKTGRTLYTSMNAGNQFGAMVPIATAEVAGTSNNTFFSNIPQTFQDLMIVCSVRSARSGPLESINIGINGQTFIYSSTRLIGNGSTATSIRGTNDQYFCYMGVVPAATSTSGIFGSAVFHILNYRSNTNKTILSRTAADLNGSGETQLGVGLFRYTPAISDVFISTEFTNTTGTITLYGIRAVSS
jgi:hypothetical protein